MKWTKARVVLTVAAPVMLIGATASDSDDSSRYTRLTLSGTGYAQQANEYISISAAATAFSTSPSGAMSDNAVDMRRLRQRLVQMGVAEDDFRTDNFNFQQGRDPEDSSGERKGYIVNHQLSVVIRNPDRVGLVMDALVAAGAKNLSINRYWGYSQHISPESLKQARAAAIRDAQAKAGDYAQALGMRVRRVVSITDQGGYSRSQPPPAMRTSIDVGTRIEARPSTVLANVGMAFELER